MSCLCFCFYLLLLPLATVCDYSQQAGTLDSDLQTRHDDSGNIYVVSTFPVMFTISEKWQLTQLVG